MNMTMLAIGAITGGALIVMGIMRMDLLGLAMVIVGGALIVTTMVGGDE